MDRSPDPQLITVFGVRRFTVEIGDLGRAQLQACGKFVGGDPCLEFGVRRAGCSMRSIECLQKITARHFTFGALRCRRVRRKEVCDGRPRRVCLEDGALMQGGKESGAPIDDTARRQSAGIRQDNKCRKVFVFAAQAVRDPRAHAWKARQNKAAVRHEHRRPMQRALALHGVDECHFINVRGKPWKKIAHPFPALAVLSERPVAALVVAGL